MRAPDGDLVSALQNNPDEFIVLDIEEVLAEVPGANEELHWHWIVRLRDGRFVYLDGWCDYTGWDCQSSLCSQFASTAESATLLAREEEELTRRRIRHFLQAQLKGTEPYGTYYRDANGF